VVGLGEIDLSDGRRFDPLIGRRSGILRTPA
jgi:hypothetical protein